MPVSNESFTLPEAQLINLFCQSVLTGIYLVSCPFCFNVLFRIDSPPRWRKASELSWLILAAFVLLFINTMLNLGLSLHRALEAFIRAEDATKSFRNMAGWVNVSKTVTVMLQPILGDAILIYRCYIVYSHNWKIIVPSAVLFCGSIAVSIKATVVQAGLRVDGTVNSSAVVPYFTSAFSLTVAQNVITTALLVARIWSVERSKRASKDTEAAPQKTSTLMRVVIIMAESGLLITLPSIVMLICHLLGTNVIYPVCAFDFVLIPISFNLIIIRASAESRRDKRQLEFSTHHTGPLRFKSIVTSNEAMSQADNAIVSRHVMKLNMDQARQEKFSDASESV